jgi:organic radical activating enzyme
VNLQTKIHVVENILTYQGEIFSGQRCLLLRFKDCNRYYGFPNIGGTTLPCKFCDTTDKMKNLDVFEISLQEIQDIINNNRCGVMITGGEPTFSNNFIETYEILKSIESTFFNVESNGFKLVDLISSLNNQYKNIKYVFSPKIFSGVELYESKNIFLELINDYCNENIYIKVVYQDTPFINSFLEYISKFSVNEKIYLMPEGKTKEELSSNFQKVLEVSNKYNFNITSRLHIIHSFC